MLSWLMNGQLGPAYEALWNDSRLSAKTWNDTAIQKRFNPLQSFFHSFHFDLFRILVFRITACGDRLEPHTEKMIESFADKQTEEL